MFSFNTFAPVFSRLMNLSISAIRFISTGFLRIFLLSITCLTVVVSVLIAAFSFVIFGAFSNTQNFEFDKAHASNINNFIREVERPYICYMNTRYLAFFEDTVDCPEFIARMDDISYKKLVAKININNENRNKREIDLIKSDSERLTILNAKLRSENELLLKQFGATVPASVN